MKIVILKNYDEISQWTAKYITKKIRDFKPLDRQTFCTWDYPPAPPQLEHTGNSFH